MIKQIFVLSPTDKAYNQWLTQNSYFKRNAVVRLTDPTQLDGLLNPIVVRLAGWPKADNRLEIMAAIRATKAIEMIFPLKLIPD